MHINTRCKSVLSCWWCVWCVHNVVVDFALRDLKINSCAIFPKMSQVIWSTTLGDLFVGIHAVSWKRKSGCNATDNKWWSPWATVQLPSACLWDHDPMLASHTRRETNLFHSSWKSWLLFTGTKYMFYTLGENKRESLFLDDMAWIRPLSCIINRMCGYHWYSWVVW